ncbi:GNAT family N-acetyltransferase [Stappia stellulata]|uniref:GNAT family N-acetyltransferase n=1 Tax=Stappia stellulata TaxID=71235 RepID=UPI001CD19A02|nr:GNAT family N-acetyltransferase [Stappia stellulata]MCA1243952.1 GNAT family N-acetyltransferase [Stappia stellulata]
MGAILAGFFGTDSQKTLQARAEASAAEIAATPGLCQAGRTMGCDDPDALGWERIEAFLQRDGICGFRLITSDQAERLRERLSANGFRLDTWDVFLTDRETALAACRPIVERGLPDGLAELDVPPTPEGAMTRRIQAMMSAAGVVPFSGSILCGDTGPAVTLALCDPSGGIAAGAHAYLPHNVASRHRSHAWGGLVAVDDAHRGKGLGRLINAMMVVAAFRDLGASHVYELVSAANEVSRRMVEACGLRHAPDLVCGLATREQAARFTR